jgi:hypothetical protein
MLGRMSAFEERVNRAREELAADNAEKREARILSAKSELAEMQRAKAIQEEARDAARALLPQLDEAVHALLAADTPAAAEVEAVARLYANESPGLRPHRQERPGGSLARIYDVSWRRRRRPIASFAGWHGGGSIAQHPSRISPQGAVSWEVGHSSVDVDRLLALGVVHWSTPGEGEWPFRKGGSGSVKAPCLIDDTLHAVARTIACLSH